MIAWLFLWFNFYIRLQSTLLVRISYDPRQTTATPPPSGGSGRVGVTIEFGRLTSHNEGVRGSQFQRIPNSIDAVSPEAAGLVELQAALARG